LDIGTGGGEALLTIAEAALLLVGIDHSVGMIETAHANLAESSKSNVRILHMDAAKIDFPDHFFNIVSNRHCSFNTIEVARILASGGFFLTQQVSEDDKFNIKRALARGQSFGVQDGTLKNRCIAELHQAGFNDIQSLDYNATEYYQSYEDLMFLLKHTPIIPHFGENENDFALLAKFISENQTDKGIRTNSKRFMIIAKK
jgi:ubiquinone/menaquinone biosynthesis C-methylase UbiE